MNSLTSQLEAVQLNQYDVKGCHLDSLTPDWLKEPLSTGVS